ncbi:MAG: hypothetical protein K8R40_01185 [Anaerolineaceae bacterium]|nr:hypothetical protein [Anaerolineaceae bacterium]
MQKNISLRLSHILPIVLVILFCSAVVWMALQFQLFQNWNNKDHQLAAHAAEEGAVAFYSIDYRENPDIWINRLCEVSTTDGCDIANTFYRNFLWPSFVDDRVRTTINVLDSESVFVEDGQQIWRVRILPGETWVGLPLPETGSQDVFISIMQDGDENWKMHRILSDEEVTILLNEVVNE